MDEAYVVLVAVPEEGMCQAFPFATKAGAEAALEFFGFEFGRPHVRLVNDHEPEMESELAGDDRSRGWEGPPAVTLE